MALNVGDTAPDFDLPATIGDRVALSGLRGEKVVVVFFPFAFSGICTGELCTVRDMSADLADLDAKVVAISCDHLHSLKAFAAKEGFEFPLLSDFWPHGAVSQEYGVFLDNVGGANRATFILDRDGKVAWSVVTALGQPREAETYRQVLAGIS